MRFEELLKEVGAFSRFQGMVVLLLCIPRIILPLHFLLHNFISAVPPHHCADPPLENGSALAEATEAGILAHTIPRKPDGSPSSCSAFLYPVGNLSNSSSAVPCQHGWVYDHSQFHSTTATQWDLVCDNKKLNQALATFFFVGVTLGAVIFGFLSDKFGRKPILLVSFVASAVFGIISAFSVSYVMFAVTRTLCGISLTGMSIISIALSVEWTDVEHRTFTGTINGLSWTVGNMLLALLAYFIRDWRQLTLAATSPCLIAIVAWWWIPESARWLLANGKAEQAHKYLSQCAKMNGKEGSSSMMNTEALSKVTIAEDSNTTYSYLDLVKTPKMKRITLCCGLVWFGVAFTYYGISFKITGFGVNMYLTHFIYAAIEVPAKVGTYFVLDAIGRRNGQAWSLIITGILIGINTAIPTDHGLLRTIIAVLGKGFSEAAFTTAFLYTTELYPTVLRQCGLGYTSFMGRLGGSLAPMIMLLEDVWTFAPSLVFAGMAVFCGCIVFLLSETLGIRLPETVTDVEEGRHKSNTESQTTCENPNDIHLLPMTPNGTERG
ncbi:solute carrier family 22 member 7-like [Lepisosteus oculatus]|uniref:solute carrier family 22 member 7-like n=1 Tax=Lepisosteus oculatus TaxID=7918 RepID=UPI0035F52010